MKTENIRGLVGMLSFFSLVTTGWSQAFTNLNFEAALFNLRGYPPGSLNVPISAALPGWSASFSNPTSGTNAVTQVWYDDISGGGVAISLIDTNASQYGVSPLSGRFSVALFGGGDGPFYAATISQTGLVPAGTESLQFQASPLGDPFQPFQPFIVMLGGQTINMEPLANLPNYTLYGGDISAFAGKVETLSITEPPPPFGEVPPSVLVLDNIIFSPSPVPEPETWALILGGAVLFLVIGHARRNPARSKPI